MMPIISAVPRIVGAACAACLLLAGLSGCGEPPALTDTPTPPAHAPPAPGVEPDHRVVVLGDSLAAGLGLAADQAFPAVLEALLRDRGLSVEVVNAGVSGDTSTGGRNRLDWVLQRPADLLVVELGGNDALRGQPLELTGENLRDIVRRGRAAGTEVVLCGMDVPINYGPDFAARFADLYPRIAEEEGAILVAGFVRELGENPSLLQPDGLHPTAEGQRRLAERLLPVVVEVIEGRTPSSS